MVGICHSGRFFPPHLFSCTFFFTATQKSENQTYNSLLRSHSFRAQVDLTTVAFRCIKFLDSSYTISGRVMPLAHMDVSRGDHEPESGSLGDDEWKPHKTNSKHVFYIIVAITRSDSQLFPQLAGVFTPPLFKTFHR